MESLNRPSKSQNDGNILLNLYDQRNQSNSTAEKLCIQHQIDEIVAHNFLLYVNGSH